jgi:alpha-N-arabinofuranosidase
MRAEGRLCRKLKVAGSLLLLVAAGAGGQIAGGQIIDQSPGPALDTQIHIRVHAGQAVSTAIPNTIFGSFLEPIGHSTYGGLWAELLENPSLEGDLWSAGRVAAMLRERPELERASQLDLPLPWEPLQVAQGNRYEPRWGDAANSYRSLLIMGLPADEVGIRQRIYLPVHRALQFKGGVWIKHVSGPSTVYVSLRKWNSPQDIFSEAKITANNDEWTKYPFELELKPGQVGHLEPADFVISLRDDSRALVDQISLMPADNVDGMDPEVIQMARDLKSPLVRFGGNFTSSYHWRDGIGPRDKRVSQLNLAWNIPEYNTFGTDEFLRFCELIGAQPQIALNLGSGTPAEAAAWVQYVNEHWKDKKGGLIWELGNELWGNWNVCSPLREQIGPRTEQFSAAIRKVDPGAQLIATGADEDSYHDWNAVQLATPPGTFEYVSTHFVVTDNRVQFKSPSNDFIALATFALPVGLEGRLKEMMEQIKASSHKEARIAFTEWLFVTARGPAGPAAPDFNNLGGAIDTAGFLNMLLRNSEIVPISDMTGILEFAGIWKKREQVYGAPGYWVLRSYADEAPTHLVPVDTDGPTYSVENGVTRLPHVEHVPWLDVVAAQGTSGNKLVLFCVNRSLTRDYRAAIQVEGFKPLATATAKTITAPSIYSENSEIDPNAVAAETSHPLVGPNFWYIFPHASVVVIELERKER